MTSQATAYVNDPEQSMLWAAYDAKAAVRWLRKNALQLRIDPNRIGTFGTSAGAMTSIYMHTIVGNGDNPDNDGVSSSVNVSTALSGALACTVANNNCYNPFPSLKQSTPIPPVLDFHGCKDSTVPYGPCPTPNKDGACWG